jgi:flagellar biosynthesis protein FliQ
VLTVLTALTLLTQLALKFVPKILVGEKKSCLQLVKARPNWR